MPKLVSSFNKNIMVDNYVDKVQDQELPVPEVWRKPLKHIADELISGRVPTGLNIRHVPDDIVQINTENIDLYPDIIGPLQNQTWQSSIYVWTGKYWEVLIDLSTKDQETSDLVFHLSVYESNDQYEFEPGLIYVP